MYCKNCGDQIPDYSAFCSRCGTPTTQNNINVSVNKDWLTALLLCIFVGALGIHRFYVGKIGTGILWLISGGVFGIGWIVDLIMIATDSFTDANGNPLRK